MKQNTLKSMFVLTILGIIFLTNLFFIVSCVPDPGTGPVINIPSTQGTSELKTFKSEEDLKEFLKESSSSSSGGFFGLARGGMVAMEAMDMAVSTTSKTMAAPAAEVAESGSADDFSTTNVQVEGVDEADIVKNDGKYIYVLTGSNLVIVDAYPAEDAEILAEVELNGNPREIFINDDKLVVFGTDYKYDGRVKPMPMELEESEEEPVQSSVLKRIPFPPYNRNFAYAKIYDISDREDPELEEEFIVRGNYHNSRMIGNYVYFITNEYARFRDLVEPCVYSIKDGEVTESCIPANKIYYDEYPDSYEFSTIMAIDLDDNDHEEKVFLKGSSQNLYVSENNIYITFQNRMPYYEQQWRILEEVFFPLLPSDLEDKVERIKSYDISQQSKLTEVQQLIERWMYEMTEEERDELEEETEDKLEEVQMRIQREQDMTVIHRIEIDGLDIDPIATGKVPGRALNQFSMDEHDGYFRIATTSYVYDRRSGSSMYNNVYVLDLDLDIVGDIEDIAPDERIYSARFIGDRLYMVTFKNIDPFFVIDISDPQDPEILGELKIPGFSDYLHPYDQDHIIGIGKETEGNQWGGVSVKGVKLGLFDVSDVENPKEIDKYEIGDRGTDSEALHDHKAFLFDKKKNLLVIPVREVKDRYKDVDLGYFRNRVWQGAYVFSLTPEDGFEVEGKITHEEKADDSYYYSGPSAVRRSLYMDDVLYTISGSKIKMNDLDDIDEEINEVELPYEFNRPVYYGRGVIEPAVMVDTVEVVR